MVDCETQEEIDTLWSKLSADPASEQCGWLKDKFGVSWQIVPKMLGELTTTGEPKKTESMMKAMLQMKKLDLQALKDAYEQG